MTKVKKLKTLLVLTAVAIGLSVTALGVAPATATWIDYDGAWYSTDGNVNVFSVDIRYLGQSDLSVPFQIYSGANFLDVMPSSPSNETYSVTFSQDTNGDIIATNYNSSTLNLGGTGYFWMKYGSYQYEYQKWEDQVAYDLRFEVGTNNYDTFNVNDASPVPIPGAALLLASGMLGLGWLKRRSEALNE